GLDPIRRTAPFRSKNPNRIIHFLTPVQERFGSRPIPFAHFSRPHHWREPARSAFPRPSAPGLKRHRAAALPNTPCPTIAAARVVSSGTQARNDRAQRSKEFR